MKLSASAIAAATLVAACAACAVEPGAVYSPHVEQGEWELEYKSFTIADGSSDENRLWNHQVALGYGVNAFWWTEIVGEYEKAHDEPGAWQALEWENRLQLTEPRQYWLDAGALVEIEKNKGGGKEAKLGLLLEKDVEELTGRLNWLVGREWGAGVSSKWEEQWRGQVVWRYVPAFEPLLEVQADEHGLNAGTGLAGHAKIGGQKLEYTAVWLPRASGDTPKNLLRFQLEVEF